MIIKLLAQNIKRGGHLDDTNAPEERWSKIVERVRSEKPDFLLLCGVVDWDRDGYRDLANAIRDFGMSAMPIAPSSNNYPTLLMYRPETVGQWKHWNPGFADQTVHGFGISAFDIGLPDLLSVVPVHIGPFSAEQVLSDTGIVASRGYRYGRFAVLGGDFNTPAARDTIEDPRSTPANFQWRYNADGSLNRLPAQKMIHADYVDCADYLFEKTGNPELIAETAQGSGRIDRFYVTYPMRDAIIEYKRLFDSSVSDHAGIVLTIDTDKIDMNYQFSIEEFKKRKHLA